MNYLFSNSRKKCLMHFLFPFFTYNYPIFFFPFSALTKTQKINQNLMTAIRVDKKRESQDSMVTIVICVHDVARGMNSLDLNIHF